MKKIFTVLVAAVMAFSIVFVSETITANAQTMQGTVKAKPRKRGVGTRVYRGGKYVGRKTWNGTKWVAHKTKRGTKWTAHKTKRGTKYTFHKTKRGTKTVYRKTKNAIL